MSAPKSSGEPLAAAALSLALLTGSAAADPSPAESTGEVEIRAVLEAFQDAWNRADLEALLETYTDPHVDVNAPSQVLTRAETGQQLRSLVEGRCYVIEIASEEVVVEGDLAFQRGHFVLTPREGATGCEATPITKRYLEVLRRGDDGRWRVFWAMDAPVEE